MTKNQIKVGGIYSAKVGENLTTVRVDAIEKRRGYGPNSRDTTVYNATNLKTGRKVVFRSALKFRSEVKEQPHATTKNVSRPDRPSRDGADLPPNPQSVSAAREDAGASLRAIPSGGNQVVHRHSSAGAPHNGLAAALRTELERTEAPAPHIVVEAYAGTGKTFTQIVGVAWAFGQAYWPEIEAGIAKAAKKPVEGFRVIPSPEQKAVWESFALSKEVKTITYCAFNRSIVNEFGAQWGWLVKLLSDRCGVTLTFATVNSLGNSTLFKTYGRLNVTDAHSENLLCELSGKSIWDLRKSDPAFLGGVKELTALCKLTLTGWTEEDGFNPEAVSEAALDQLVSHFDLELNGSRDRVYDMVPRVLEAALDPKRWGTIDYNDQNWLPVVLKLGVAKSDLLLVDEAQDLPRCKQEYVRLAGRRICVVGDVNQAIYGFAGADVDSIPRMSSLLGVSESLRLTETRRCGKAIVEEARKIVPGFRAHESNPTGLVRHLKMNSYATEAQDGDMCLCRVNAPLVSEALKQIKNGRKAIIRGREFGATLTKFVEKQKAASVVELVQKVSDWRSKETEKEQAKKNPSEARLISFNDRYECILAFSDGSDSVAEVITKIRTIFTGKECPKCRKMYDEKTESCYDCKGPLVQPKGILYSSIHKAKGLEANRVYLLEPKGATVPHPMAKSASAKKQEINLRYVGITRSINELVFVGPNTKGE